ncbi:toll-like receptor 2 [Babylonia areolata]|uniref:toll-like receptor 2 n=1 Tax=Babylonia areolata TaxID=304850 RepID=UPI003FD65CE2
MTRILPVFFLCVLSSVTTMAARSSWHPHLRASFPGLSRTANRSAHAQEASRLPTGGGRRCFQNACLCDRRVADCSHNYGRLSFIPQLPRSIRSVLFSFNRLTRIANETFFDNVTGVVSVDLSHNGLMYIHPDAFKSLSNLTTLILDHNRLSYAAMVPVLSAPSLQVLRVAHNGLGPVPRDFFSRTSMPPIRVLNLTGNPLQNLNQSAFLPLTHLSSLVVAQCRLIITSGGRLPRLTQLDVSGNALFDLPPSCDPQGLSWLPRLQTLYASQNVFSAFESRVCLPELTLLDLSQNPIVVIRTDMFNGSAFPRLAGLALENIQTLEKIEPFAFRNPSLRSLSLKYCNLPFSEAVVHPDSFRGIPRLIYLQLSHNLGSYLPDEKFLQLFGSLHALRGLNLGTCGIQKINENLFRNLRNLTNLLLYRNKLTEIPDGTFSSLKELRVLKMGDNELRTVRESTFSEETRRQLQQLDLSGNLFVCDCDLLWFKEWFMTSPIFRGPYRDYECSNLPNTSLERFTMIPQACLWSHASYSALMACVVAFLILLSCVSVVHYYRWHIRLRLAFRGHGDLMRRRLQNQDFDYDIFLSFAGDDLPWVRRHLLPLVEGSWGLRVCVHERDFVPGKSILNNIVDCVKASRRFMTLFSRHYVTSPWCQFELDLCLGHVMDHDDALIVTCLDDIASRDMTCAMEAVLKTTTYLQWPGREGGGRDDLSLFWRRVELSVKDLLKPQAA